MWALAIQRVACTFAILYLVFDPKINVIGGEKELEKILPSEYKEALGSGVTVLKDIWEKHSIRYAHSSDNVTTIIFYGRNKIGWLGIGFSETGLMAGSSAMVGWTTREDGKNMIKQYSLEAPTPANVVPDKGDLQLTKVAPVYTIIKRTRYIAFQLKLPSMQQNVIFATTPIPPTGDMLTIHWYMATIKIDFSKGVVDNTANIIKSAHGWVAFFGWVFFIPIGVTIAHHFRYCEPQWFHMHVSIQILGYVLAFVTVILGLTASSALNISRTFHKILGITALLLATLQVLAVCARPAKDAPERRYWNMYHRGVGYLAAAIAITNFYLGLKFNNGGFVLKLLFPAWVLLALIGNCVLVSYTRKKRDAHKQHRHPVFIDSSPSI